MKRLIYILLIFCGTGCLSLGATCNRVIDDLQGQEPQSELQQLIGELEDLIEGLEG